MSFQPKENLLLAKATQGKRQREARIVTAVRGLRHGLARAAEDLWALPVGCSGIEQKVLPMEDALDRLDDDALILVITAPDGAYALVVLDRAVLTGLIEIQTLGAVYDVPVEARSYTTTDAAMAWLYLDRALTIFADAVEDRAVAGQLQGYRLEEAVPDPRTASLWLAPGDFQVFEANVSLAQGKRTGGLKLVLPQRKVPPPPTERKPTGQLGKSGFEWLPISLDVVIPGISVSLSQACNLAPGDFLPLPPDILEQAELRGVGGHKIVSGKLGQWNGLRALKLTDPGLPDPGPRVGPQPEDSEPFPSDGVPGLETPEHLPAVLTDPIQDLPEQELSFPQEADLMASIGEDMLPTDDDPELSAEGMADLEALEALIDEPSEE